MHDDVTSRAKCMWQTPLPGSIWASMHMHLHLATRVELGPSGRAVMRDRVENTTSGRRDAAKRVLVVSFCDAGYYS